MTDDTDWLKKNPRMSVWRTSRFFGQDMDGSLMGNDQKSKNDVLLVSHMPRRSNIPMEKLKQMDFKFPIPVSKKSGMKKPVTRVSKFVVPQVAISRPSMNPRSGDRTGVQKQGFVKPNGRSSILSRSGTANAYSKNELRSNSKADQSTPMILGKFNQHSVKGTADLSLLSQSKVVNQSTPNETTVLRSILKQKRNSGRRCSRNLLDGKKPPAVKRVNFNGSIDDIGQEQVNEESEIGVVSIVGTEEGIAPGLPAGVEKKENVKINSGEGSTAVFSNGVKPALGADEAQDNSGNGENQENKENEAEAVEKSNSEGKELTNAGEIHSKNTKSGFSGKFISGLMDLWKIYHNEVNHIRTELQLIDVNFEETVQLIMNNEIEKKLTVYEEEKSKLYQRLKDLEVEFRENVKNHTDVKTLFSNYIERKKNILSAQSELEENFEKSLRMIVDKYKEESGFTVTETSEESENMEISAERFLHGKKVAKRESGAKRISGCSSGVKKRSTPRKRSSRELKVSDASTPDNTPARRRKLSRKIEKQLRNLFEE